MASQTPGSRQHSDRLAEPVDQEQRPRLPFPVIGIGASAGGLEAFSEFLSNLRPDSGMAYVLIQHLSPNRESMMADILSKRTTIPVLQVEDGMPVQPNHIYVIRPGYTLTLNDGRLRLGEPLDKPGHSRPVDDFFRSLAAEQRERAVAVVLSGMGSNGALGAQAVKAVGGLCIAQDPDTAKFNSMPRATIDAGLADYILRAAEIPDVVLRYAQHPYTAGRVSVEPVLQKEGQHLKEILSLLRTRTRHDFNGYRKPTVIRRIQRRMGVNQVTTLNDYAKILRQRHVEIQALSDDLMIHVTGFFRDAEAWESLRQQVIVPLVRDRENGASIRAWVSACASGEEAFTLAILFAEAAEAASKQFDFKIFATDTAERALGMARAGVYPGGIESEISPERLDRFFDREDAYYRIKRALREMVVFAPQNVLQDPPFSHLDIITCRNLLIYLEPEIQRRVLHLLHFGIHEGGVLFLGNSETIGDADDLFEPVDKKHRIFRRVGPTRHGLISFPVPASLTPVTDGNDPLPRPPTRISLASVAQHALIERYVPPAVVVDRHGRIAYFYGDTHRFLVQPPGEPTRDLLAMARESIRGPLRVALQKSISSGEPVTLRGGVVDRPDERKRVYVTAAPMAHRELAGHFLVSFEEQHEAAQERSPSGDGNGQQLRDELQRAQDELQSTIQELQASNEELKAGNEEITSINEELQSTNEELETSKEELQSLNEELTTVNAQLQAKMQELEATTNDLSSLLSSTDIAVIFLDTRFRIRRFTPAVKDLIELRSADVGRPLAELAPKFIDPDLMADAQTVLNRLIPVEREVASEAGRNYLRRVLPYRTADNRIDGVVLTFVDITERRTAQAALRESEDRYRLILENIQEYVILLLDADGVIVTWNPAAQRILGFSGKEIVGQNFSVIFTDEDRAVGAPRAELDAARASGVSPDERWHVRKDGSRFWGSGVLSAVHDAAGGTRGFIKILRDNTERKRHEEALERAKGDAERAIESKDQFLATLSHELRTPLTAIILWARILRDSDPAAAQIRPGLDAILSGAEAQHQLIEDLLDVARMTSGKLRLDLQPTDLASVIRAALDAIRPAADARELEVSAQLDPDVGIVRADPNRLQQVLWNLLTNSVKFTPVAGQISVALRRVDGEVEISITDTGKGLAPEIIPLIFERFQQGDLDPARQYGGLGLGLAICRQLVEMHGGSITAHSAGVGQGATFTIRLPLPSISGDAAAADIANSTEPNIAGVRILLVEDNHITRQALTILLREYGGQIAVAASAGDAFTSYQNNRPDVIISDIGLPDEDGNALLQRIRLHEKANRLSPLPAIALSAFTRRDDHRRTAEGGFLRHLDKPVDPRRLVSIICEVLTESRLATPAAQAPSA